MRSVRPRTRCVGAALALAVLIGSASSTVAPHAYAQPDDGGKKSAARTLATDGLAAFNAGKYADAIDLFGRAEALVHAPPHLLYIARANAALGKLVQANETYVKITREELFANSPKAFAEAKKNATTEQAAIEPRIAKLTILVKGGTVASSESTSVTMDGVEVPRALVGVPHPVDPGPHVLRAKASGYKTNADVNIKLADGASETTTLELVVDNSGKTVVTAPVKDEKPKGGGVVGIAPWIAFGVGVAGLGAGTFFMMQNRSKRDEADSICADAPCPAARRDEIVQLDKDADGAGAIAWIGYGVGAAGIITGAALLIFRKPSAPAPSASSASASTSAVDNVHFWFGATAAGMKGTF